jgi:hypothetical protein
MPLVVVRIAQTNPPKSIFEVDVNFGPQGLTEIHLVGYRATGLLANNPPLFLSLRNQAILPVYGNLGSRVPMLFAGDGTNINMVGDGYPLSGTHRFNDSVRLYFEISDANNNTPVFTELFLILFGKDVFDGSRATFTKMDASFAQR